MTLRFIGLILLPWTFRPGGGQLVNQLGSQILVTLAHHNLNLTCEVIYPYIPIFKKYQFSYYHIDSKGRQSISTVTPCKTSRGVENQTHVETCPFTLYTLHNASATGTYYCQVAWPSHVAKSQGTFVLVLDAGYTAPPKESKKLFLITSTSIVTVLSIFGTALLFWMARKQRSSSRKRLNQKDPDPAKCTEVPEPNRSGSIYTALQPYQQQVYDCLQNDVSNQPTQKQYQVGEEEEFNAIYENF